MREVNATERPISGPWLPRMIRKLLSASFAQVFVARLLGVFRDGNEGLSLVDVVCGRSENGYRVGFQRNGAAVPMFCRIAGGEVVVHSRRQRDL